MASELGTWGSLLCFIRTMVYLGDLYIYSNGDVMGSSELMGSSLVDE